MGRVKPGPKPLVGAAELLKGPTGRVFLQLEPGIELISLKRLNPSVGVDKLRSALEDLSARNLVEVDDEAVLKVDSDLQALAFLAEHLKHCLGDLYEILPAEDSDHPNHLPWGVLIARLGAGVRTSLNAKLDANALGLSVDGAALVRAVRSTGRARIGALRTEAALSSTRAIAAAQEIAESLGSAVRIEGEEERALLLFSARILDNPA